MKKKLLLFVLLVLALSARAEDINHGGLALESFSDDRWALHVSGGLSIPTGAPDGVDFSTWRSWETNLTPVQYEYTPRNTPMTFSVGLGVTWRRYALKGDDMGFFKVDDLIVVSHADPLDGSTTLDKFSSQIRTTSLSMPLLAKYNFSQTFAVSLGVQLNWNFYGRVYNHYSQGDHDVDMYTKKIGQRPFTVDVLGIFHVLGVGIYCKYSPMKVLKKDRGPEFNAVSIGVYF